MQSFALGLLFVMLVVIVAAVQVAILLVIRGYTSPRGSGEPHPANRVTTPYFALSGASGERRCVKDRDDDTNEMTIPTGRIGEETRLEWRR